jgi:hypothetical protein
MTQMEEMLVARLCPVMTVYTVHGGERKGSKHVINFPQNVSRLAMSLPQKPEHIPLVVRRLNLHDDKHYDFRVRRNKVKQALEWLKRHHKWYRDVTILVEALEDLPIDDNIEHLFVRQIADLPIPAMPAQPQEPQQNIGENGEPNNETLQQELSGILNVLRAIVT